MILGWLVPFTYGDVRHHGAHTHGEGQVRLVLEGNALEAELVLPGEDAVGFEGEAKTDARKKKLETTIAALEKPDSLRPTGGECVFQSAKGKWAGKGKHRELRVRYTYECKQPDKLSGVAFGFKKQFPKLEHLELTAVLPEGQKKTEIEGMEWRRR